jgi:hypothetical protein
VGRDFRYPEGPGTRRVINLDRVRLRSDGHGRQVAYCLTCGVRIGEPEVTADEAIASAQRYGNQSGYCILCRGDWESDEPRSKEAQSE